MNLVISIALLLTGLPRAEGDQPNGLPSGPEPSSRLPP
ncbi:THY1 isoform 7 [Pongo abelii]|uniref:THY1 isoform 7 n=1 Tax=Pongo abelii TaxID=9601 RepID=A0A2J8X0I0_PONAB|nr:THY1 isoform 7 [Pongo abelii]